MISNATPTMQAGLRELGEFYDCPPAQVVRYDAEENLYLFRALSFMGYSYERNDGNGPEQLRTPLGMLACHVDALRSHRGVSFDGSTCDDSEPSFVDSLYRLQEGARQTHTPVLYVDSDSRPIAFGKGMGSKTTIYLQHSPSIVPELPLGSIITNQVGRHRSDDWLGSRNAISDKSSDCLQVVTLKKPVKAEIARASIFSLTPDYVKACGYRVDNLGYTHDATAHSLQDIQNMVDSIAHDAGIY